MDKLLECAKSFEVLLDKKYHIIIGRKGKSVDLEITFEAVDFHHLMGLHKLKDVEALSGKREKVFRDILAGRISISNIGNSSYFDQIAKRIEFFADLEDILDANNLVFKYNEKAHSFSLIQAEYLLSTPYKANEIYIFLDKKSNGKQFFCRSFFPKESKDYTIGQPTYTLLFKEKITISTGEREIQYDRLSPKQRPDLMAENTPSPALKPTAEAPAEPARQSMKERMAEAQAEADRRNSSRTVKQVQPDKKRDPER